jgi:hypothetical protein
MNDEVKARLAAAARVRRGVLLKDIDATTLRVLADAVKDEGLGEQAFSPHGQGCYLKFAAAEQLQALCDCFPSSTVLVIAGPKKAREVFVFERRAVVRLLVLAGVTHVHKYIRCC